MHATSFTDLRAQVEAKIQAMPNPDGVTMPAAAITQVCFVIMGLASPGGAEDLRKGDTVEHVLLREHFVAWVAETFAEEVAQYEHVFQAAMEEFLARTGPGGTTLDAVHQYITMAQREFFK